MTNNETDAAPNERLANRVEELNAITATTVEAAYDGGSVFELRSERAFQRDTFDALRTHDYRITRQRDDALYVEKHPDTRRHR